MKKVTCGKFPCHLSKIINISRTVVVSILFGWREVSAAYFYYIYISGQLCVVYCGGGGGVRRLKDTKFVLLVWAVTINY